MSDDYAVEQMALYNFIVDTLVDMSDPDPEEMDEARDDMMSVASILFEGLDLKVIGSDGNRVTVTVSIS